MYKKILSGLLAVAIVFGSGAVLPVEELTDSGVISVSAETYGDYEYAVLSDGTVQISRYTGSDSVVTIPNTINGKKVTSIGSEAFGSCRSLTSITIPNSVTSIKYSAFKNCTSLTNVTIPNSVTYIENYAFSGCASLTSITIPDSVTSIGESAFEDCTSLTSITIPDSVTSIGESAFHECKSLTSIEIPNSVTSIGRSAFYGCTNLTSITIPDSVTSIRTNTFDGCTNLTNVTIPNSVTSIEYSAFRKCTSLTSITIPNSVTYIGGSAFEGCSSLTNVTIPNSVTSISYDAFRECTSLTSITIPNSVTYIGSSAFYGCTNLTSITIPNSVTSIGGYAFYGCESLTIKCYAGSTAEQYAKDNNIPYEIITNTKKQISSCTVTLGAATNYFRGTRIKPSVTIKDGTKTLKQGTDYTVAYYDNLSVGTASVKITGKGNYSGTVTKTFKIVQRSIGNCDIQLGASSYYFNGTRIRPSVKVFCNGVEMYSGNYTVSYANNLAAGNATITLTGKNNLKGTVTKTFKINPRNIANCTVSMTKNTSNKYKPNVSVNIGSTEVYNGNYTVSYVTSADKKTVKVTLTGKSNLAGKVTKTYTVS